MQKQKLDQKRARAWRVLLTGGLLIGALVFLWAHRQAFGRSAAAASGASAWWLSAALLLMITTFFIASATYGVLAFHRLRYLRTVLVELAAASVNRLLPAGLGGLGINGLYLYRQAHTPAEATVVVSVNNLLGMVAHALILAVAFAVWSHAVFAPILHWRAAPLWRWSLMLAIALCAVVFVVPWVRRRLLGFGCNLAASVQKLSGVRILRALLLSMLLTIAYTLILFCTARSISVSLNVLQVFIVFSFGMLAGTITPTPGGLVGAEAGLFFGLVSYGVGDVPAGATVLLFRLITYWLPLLPGIVALLVARRSRLL